MTRFLLTCALFTLALPCAFAQPLTSSLAEIAPAETVLTLGYKSSGEGGSNSLKDDLTGLEWQQAGETLQQLGAYLENSDLSGDFQDLSDLLNEFSGGLDTQNEGRAMLEQFCPELLDERFNEIENIAADALLAVSVSPFNPVPAVTALFRADGETELYADLQEIIITCAEREVEVVRLVQGDVPLYVIGDGGDFPVIIGRSDDLFFAGSNPQVLRGVVRRAQGNSEANFAGGRLYSEAREVLEAEGVSFSLNLAGLAQIAENFGGLFVSGPEMEGAFERGLAILRTLEGYAGSVRATSEGLEAESLTVVNAEGGDPELADLLLCDTCAVSSPFLAPETSVGVNAQYVALEPIFNYLQGVLNDLEPLVGESLDIKAILREEFGFDLDTALFDWLGNEVYSVVLEPFSADLGTLFYGQASAFYVPITSQEAAEAGLAELGEGLAFVLEASEDMDMDEFSSQLFSDVATETYTYEDVEITRYRSGVNTDVGVAFLGNYLVFSTPAGALESLIDTFNGTNPNIFANRSFQTAFTDRPEEVTLLNYSEYGTTLAGLADLLGLFSQPLAFAANIALAEVESADAQTDTQKPNYAELLTLTDLLPNALEVIAEHVGAASGYSEVREGAVYRRGTLQIDW